jgi:hypothetical protein
VDLGVIDETDRSAWRHGGDRTSTGDHDTSLPR